MRNYFNGGPGRQYLDPRVGYAQHLIQQGTDTSPVQHWGQGLGRLAQALTGAYLQKQAMNDRTAATQAFVEGGKPRLKEGYSIKAPGPGIAENPYGDIRVSPDADPFTRRIAQRDMEINKELYQPTPQKPMSLSEQVNMATPGLAPNTQPAEPITRGGTLSERLAQLAQMPDNPYAQEMIQKYGDMQMMRDFMLGDEQRQRGYKKEDMAAMQGFQREMAGASQGFQKELADIQFERQKAMRDRKIIKGADGRNYYEDTKQPVLPGVQPKPDLTAIEKQLRAEGFTPGTPAYKEALKNYREKTPKTEVTTNVDIGEKSMTELGKQMSKELVTQRGNAVGARNALNSIREAKRLLDSGIITGTGAEFITSMGSFLESRLGYDLGDPVSNTQAFAATMGNQVGQIIKQFGAGTGLSDADREYAEKIVGGKINVTEKAIRRLIDINEKAHNNVIKEYNKLAEQAMKKPGADALPYDLRIDEPGPESNLPEGVDPEDWKYLSPEEKAKFSQ